MKTTILILSLALSLHAEEPKPPMPTPEQRIELLKADNAQLRRQISLLQQLLQLFQNQPTPEGVTLQALRDAIEKEVGCKLDSEGLCLSKQEILK